MLRERWRRMVGRDHGPWDGLGVTLPRWATGSAVKSLLFKSD